MHGMLEITRVLQPHFTEDCTFIHIYGGQTDGRMAVQAMPKRQQRTSCSYKRRSRNCRYRTAIACSQNGGLILLTE